MATNKDFIVKNGLLTGGTVYLNGASSSYNGNISGITLNYAGNGTQYGFTMKPATSTADTYAINFLASTSTYGSATTVGSIQHLANDAGMNLAGTWKLNGATIATTNGTANNVTGVVAIANGGTGATTATTALTNLGAQKTTVWSLTYNGSTATWFKLGTLTSPQGGFHTSIRIYTGAGYNALNSQDSEAYIHFKTSNGSSVDANGFAGNAVYHRNGVSLLAVQGVKFVANAAGTSATSFDVYISIVGFMGTATMAVETTGTFTYAGTTATDPGVGSATVHVATENLVMPNVTSATFGAGATIQDSGTVNSLQIKGSTNPSSGFIKFGNAPQVFGYDTANLVYGSKVVAFTDSNISGTAANVSGTVAIANGGTGATTATAALTNFGFKAGLTGQTYFITGDSTNAVNPGFTLAHSKVVENASELADAQAGTVDQGAVFNTWYRFSHNSTNTYPADATETSAWTYNTTLGRIENTTNSSTVIGVVSPDSYDNYYLKTRVMSTNTDDDFIGVVLAFVVSGGREYTLTAFRSNNAASKWMVRYNHGQSDAYTVYNGDSFITASYVNGGTAPNQGWLSAGIGCVIEAQRAGTTISVVTSEMASTTLVEATRYNIDLNADARLQKFITPSRIGYFAYSQASSSWNDVVFTSTADAIYDIINNKKYVYDAPSQTWVSSTTTVQSDIGVGKFVFSTNNKRLYYVKNSAVVSSVLNPSTASVNSASRLTTPRTINGVAFDGTANITIADSTKLPLTGGTLTGGLTIANSAPVIVMDETDQTGAAGKWRLVADGAGWRIDMNTATARDFTSYVNPVFVSAAGATTVSLASSSVQLKLNRTATLPGAGWIGADSTNAFNVYTDVSGTPTTKVFGVDNTGIATVTGRLIVPASATGGIAFPNDAFGGVGDTATITLQNPNGGESTELTFAVTNDAQDIIHFKAPSNDGVKINGNVVWHAGNLTNVSQLANGPGYLTSTSAAYQSARDFANGTLITTGIDYSQATGAAWMLEITGNAYGNLVPFSVIVQGYIYNSTIINTGGISTGTDITGLIAQNIGGKLCFWFPRLAYWHGFSVFVSDVTTAGPKVNQLVSISDTVRPTGTKEVAFTLTKTWNTSTLTNLNQLTNGPGYTTAAAPVFTGNVRVSTATGISAAGTTQATATALSADLNVVSTVAAGSGVVLPTASAGMKLIIINTSATTLNVYPASGGTIDALALNAAFALGPNSRIEIVAVSSTQWYAMTATLAA